MSKVTQMLSEQDLDRHELAELIFEANKLLKQFRPYRIKEVFKTCGKPDCLCRKGLEHGPYLYVSYRDGKKTVQKSLGLKLTDGDFSDIETAERPDHFDEKYHVLHSSVEGLTREKRNELGLKYIALTHEQFEDLYGMHPEEDRFDRPMRLWVDYGQYEADTTAYNDLQRVLWSPWSQFGVGTAKGIDILYTLENRGYYLVK